MATTWYIQKNNHNVGPLSAQQLRELALAGKLRGDDLVRKGEDGEFTPASRITNLFAPDQAATRPTPPPPRLSESHKPQPTPASPTSTTPSRRLRFSRKLAVIVPIAVVALVSAGVLLMNWRHNSADSASNAVGDKAPSTSSQDAGPAEREAYETLPQELRRFARTVDLPLAEPLDQMRQTNSELNDLRLRFSPSSQLTFVLTLAIDRKQQTLRVFRTDTGSPVVPEKAEIDYFSFPAILSPDESHLACCDGDFLRIWKLNATSANLLQSIRLPDELETAYGYRMNWRQDSTLAVSARPSGPSPPRRIQVYRRNANGAFEKAGKTVIAARHTDSNGYSVDPSDADVSADGRVALVVSRSRQGNTVRIIDVGTGKTEQTLVLSGKPAWNWGQREFPSTEINLRTENQRNGDPTCSLQMSPHGKHLLCGVADDTDVTVEVFRTSEWRRVGKLPAFTPLCFSHDGKLIAGFTSDTARTSRGAKVSRTVVVYDLDSCEQVMSVDMGEKFGESDSGYGQPNLLAAFSADDSTLTAFYSKELKGWNEERNRAEMEWVLGAWNVKTGSPEFSISRIADKATVSEFAMSTSGDLLFNGLAAWDVSHLVALDRSLTEADRLWDEGKHADALAGYGAIINDSYTWFVEEALPRAYSRSIDIFAERDRVEDGRAIVVAMERLGMEVSVETESGRSLVSQFNQERLEAQRRMAAEAREREAARIAQVRAVNQALFRPASTMTKQEFIEKMDQTKSMGIISSHGVNAIFDDYAFQDVFGKPDSEVSSDGVRKWLLYRCSNGRVQLRAVSVEGRTVVSEINHY